MYQLLSVFIISLSMGAESRVMLSPSGEVSVCPGGQISFTCSTNLGFLEWNVTVLQSEPPNSYSRRQLITPGSQLDLHLVINEHIFNITRNSTDNARPLVSTLTVANAVADLSATKINCTDIGSSITITSTSLATISVINPVHTHPDPPDVGIPKVLEFGTDSVIVLIEWIQMGQHENDVHVVYSIDATPPVNVVFIKSSSAQLQVSYNTQYNVSIIASLCGRSNATTMIILNFVKCIHPLNLPMVDNSVRVLLDNDSVLVDTNATFSCPPGLVFSGPMKSTCMENGEWEPDPREVDCIANCGPPSPPPSGYIFPYTSTIDGAIVNFVCQKSAWNLKENLTVTVCNKQGKWDPNPAEFCAIVSGTPALSQDTLIAIAVESSVAVLIALLLFIIGLYCGRFHKKGKKRVLRKSTPPPRSTGMYYNMPPSSKHDNTELTEQETVLQTKSNCPVVTYDDVLPYSQQDNSTDSEVDTLPAKPSHPIVAYDDVLSPSEQNFTTKPKVFYDEVLPPGEQEHDIVDLMLKKNTAYRPAESK